MGTKGEALRLLAALGEPYSMADAVKRKLEREHEGYSRRMEGYVMYLLGRKTEKVIGNIDRENRKNARRNGKQG